MLQYDKLLQYTQYAIINPYCFTPTDRTCASSPQGNSGLLYIQWSVYIMELRVYSILITSNDIIPVTMAY